MTSRKNGNSRYEIGVISEDDAEAVDSIAPLCTCGCDQTVNSTTQSMKNSGSQSLSKGPSWLESSFVHLLTPTRPSSACFPASSSNPDIQIHHCHGYLESFKHLSQLLDASTTANSDISLCSDCIDRVAAALESDTERLSSEAEDYREATKTSLQRAKTLQNLSGGMQQEQTHVAYQNEIDMLRHEVEAREAELSHLHQVYQGQLFVKKQIDIMEEEMEADQNSLELRAKAFDSTLQLLTSECAGVEMEVTRLSQVKLPQSLFDLQVDDRGLRYPLINRMRLAFRPKGDVPAREIQIAWSQATQLLLFVGTLLDFKSKAWKLVPLSDCAKLIYKKDIYNLTPGDCRGLLAYNALLDQVLKHAVPKTKEGMNPSYPSSSTSIGPLDLTSLDQRDNASWSRVIHYMASNLLWLTQRTAELTSYQVSTVINCVS